jgi:hypothetical protein
MELAPIVIFVYNRLLLLKQTVEALIINLLADQSDLFIYADGSKNSNDLEAVIEVRAYLKSISGFKSITIFEREKNYGLSVSIIEGVTEIINRYGKIIVLEDDLVTSPYYLKFINDALNMYENDEQVISVQGYVYPLKDCPPDFFFIKGADCQGWATWKRGWDLFEKDGKILLENIKREELVKEFNFENSYPYFKMLKAQTKGKVNSWAVRWYATAFLNNKLTLYPGKTLIYNTGFGSGGTNTNDEATSSVFNSEINNNLIDLQRISISESIEGRKCFINFFKSLQSWRNPKLMIQKIARKILG